MELTTHDGYQRYRMTVPLMAEWIRATRTSRTLPARRRASRMTPVNDPPYEVLNNRTAPMRGRLKQVEALRRHLTKPTPDHVSVIGPKHIGKTMLLKHVASGCAARARLT